MENYMALKIGDKIPSFSLKDQEGDFVNSNDLLGSPFIVYFYPKDDTPGCTKEACSFRDHMDHMDDLDVIILGISPDNPDSHKKFADKYDLNFTLLCDEKMDVAKKFGAVKPTNDGILRSTFLVDGEGIIRWIEQPVSVDGHTERVLEAINDLSL